MYEVHVRRLLSIVLIPAILLYRKWVGRKKSIPLGQKKTQCRVVCIDRATGYKTEQAWFGLDHEKYLEEWIKSLKGGPMLGNVPISARFEYKIDYA